MTSVNAATALAWKGFLEGHPEMWGGWRTAGQVAEDELLNRFDDPKPDYGNEMESGRCWHGDDKCRTRRVRRPTRRAWSDQSMIDGSPLRIPDIGELDVDGDPFVAPADCGAIGESPDRIPDDPEARDYADDKKDVGRTVLTPPGRAECLGDHTHCGVSSGGPDGICIEAYELW